MEDETNKDAPPVATEMAFQKPPIRPVDDPYGLSRNAQHVYMPRNSDETGGPVSAIPHWVPFNPTDPHCDWLWGGPDTYTWTEWAAKVLPPEPPSQLE